MTGEGRQEAPKYSYNVTEGKWAALYALPCSDTLTMVFHSKVNFENSFGFKVNGQMHHVRLRKFSGILHGELRK